MCPCDSSTEEAETSRAPGLLASLVHPQSSIISVTLGNRHDSWAQKRASQPSSSLPIFLSSSQEMSNGRGRHWWQQRVLLRVLKELQSIVSWDPITRFSSICCQVMHTHMIWYQKAASTLIVISDDVIPQESVFPCLTNPALGRWITRVYIISHVSGFFF